MDIFLKPPYLRIHEFIKNMARARTTRSEKENDQTFSPSRYTLRQIVSVTLFEKMPVQDACPGRDHTSEQGNDCNQLNLFAC